MAWERRSESDYYYRKYRLGERVYSQYLGKGKAAKIAAEEDQLNLEIKSFNKSKWDRIKEEEKEFDRMVRLATSRSTKLFKAYMLVNGYHTHKGQWRKKRVESNPA